MSRRVVGVGVHVGSCVVAVCVAAGACSLVERRLFTSVVRDVLSVLLSGSLLCVGGGSGGVEPRDGSGGGVGTLLGPEGSSLPPCGGGWGLWTGRLGS
jgi:hypothetical protein